MALPNEIHLKSVFLAEVASETVQVIAKLIKLGIP